MQHCWEQDPQLRPEVADVLKVLQSLSVSPPFLQQLRHLDRSWPGFPNQLNDVLCEGEYREYASNLQADDLVWLIEYLDEVRHCVAISHPPLKLVCRLSMLLTLPAPVSISACASSGAYAEPKGYSQHRIQFRPTF